MSNKQEGRKNAITTIVVQMNGGVIHCVNANAPVRVIFLDEETEGADDEGIMKLNGEEVYVTNKILDELANTAASGITDGIDAAFVEYIVAELEQGEGAS